MNPIRRALIVDDEQDARATLRRLLEAHPQVEVVGEADSAVTAISQFHALKPDLIFLDVQMPKRDGFSLLPELRPVPDIVFTTAYGTFALKAFEVNAVDFLLKPIHPERLALSLLRLTRPLKRKAKPFTRDDAVFLYSDHEMRVVDVKEVMHIRSDGNYGHIRLANGKTILMRRKMAEWQRLLPPGLFLRLDRSTIVNLSAIRETLAMESRHAAVHFHGLDEPLELRRMAARRLRKALRDISLA